MVKIVTYRKMKGNMDILSAKGIKKSFSGVEVLHGMDFTLREGEIHGLVGQNGAGKSTLMKIINGIYAKDEGTIQIHGNKADYSTPGDANRFGIAMVFQEFSLIPTMTATENIFLTRESKKGIFVDEKTSNEKAEVLFKELDIEIDPKEKISSLSVGERQIVEIAKALGQNAEILILDEPTASLSNTEINSLFKLLRKLKKDGISIIFVSHHLNEIMEICDRVTIVRDGMVALADDISKLTLDQVISAMVGRKFTKNKIARGQKIDKDSPLLEINQLSYQKKYSDINLKLYPGEILGIAGVLGSGRSEILKTIYGILLNDSGEIIVKGEKVKINHPSDAIKLGIVYVPEDRRNQGVIYGQSVRMNMLLSIWKRLTRGLLIQKKESEAIVERFIQKLDIKLQTPGQLIERLSGGNQQKVVFAKSLTSDPQILLLDDPTVGVDVGTKRDISQIIKQIADKGNGVVFVSSEFEELADLCDRILVLNRGKIVDEIDEVQSKKVDEGMLMLAVQRNGTPA